MYPVTCTNIHHDVTNFINQGMAKIQKLEYLDNRTELFYEIKTILTYASGDKF